MSFLVTLDSVGYTSKPGAEVGAITRRLQAAGPTECDYATLCAAIERGQTWVGGTFEPCAERWGAFQQQQIFALDFDNTKHEGGGSKRPLREGEPGYLDPFEAVDRCIASKMEPMCLYFTFSAALEPLWLRYRLVIDMGEPLGMEQRDMVVRALLRLYPEADQACSNANRLFFGSRWKAVEYWRHEWEAPRG